MAEASILTFLLEINMGTTTLLCKLWVTRATELKTRKDTLYLFFFPSQSGDLIK